MRLSDLKTGESATILKVLGHGGFRRRIMEMGFVRGKKVEVVLNARCTTRSFTGSWIMKFRCVAAKHRWS